MSFIPEYLLILFAIILVDFSAAILIEKAQDKYRQPLLWISIVINLAFLATFKYSQFLVENINWLFSFTSWSNRMEPLHLILPIGLSFHTFQSMSYTIDVYRKKIKAERHLGYFACYVLFFPQLVAGPIERASHLIPQLKQAHTFNSSNLIRGLQNITMGLLLKCVIADRLSIIVNAVYKQPTSYDGFTQWLAAYSFAFQLYLDFYAYSLIAIGSARCLGIVLSENFKQPFMSTSMSQFFIRWHITLYKWFLDYIFTPLGGRSRNKMRAIFNTLLIFALSGLWHKGNWNWVTAMTTAGLVIVLESYFSKITNKLKIPTILKVFYLMSIVSFLMVTVRQETLSQAQLIYSNMLHFGQFSWSHFLADMQYLSSITPQMSLAFAFLLVLLTYEYLLRYSSVKISFQSMPAIARWPIYYAILFLICFYGIYGQEPYIYFQF